MKIRQVLNNAIQSLTPTSPTPKLDGELIIMRVLSISTKEELLLVLDQELNAKCYEEYQALLSRRLQGEPIAYITNSKWFWDTEFYVDSNVLIPRPETELIIESVLSSYPNRKINLDILDLGTGSGCIAITLAKLYPNSSVLAVDISEAALNVAQKNVCNLNNISFLQSNWFSNIPNKKFDIIVSNPPYIAPITLKDLTVAKFEPETALTDYKDGLHAYRTIAESLSTFLKPEGMGFFEIGYDQGKAVLNIFSEFKELSIVKDFQRHDRVLVVKNF